MTAPVSMPATTESVRTPASSASLAASMPSARQWITVIIALAFHRTSEIHGCNAPEVQSFLIKKSYFSKLFSHSKTTSTVLCPLLASKLFNYPFLLTIFIKQVLPPIPPITPPPTPRPECRTDDECPYHRACFDHKCQDPCEVRSPCGVNTECHTQTHVPICTCIAGYMGNPLVQCIKRMSFPSLCCF